RRWLEEGHTLSRAAWPRRSGSDARHGAPLRVADTPSAELESGGLALADGDELPVLDLDQRALLDRVTRMLAVHHVDDRDLAVGAGEPGKVLDVGQRLAHLFPVGLQRL